MRSPASAGLDRLDAVERDAGVGDERPPGLEHERPLRRPARRAPPPPRPSPSPPRREHVVGRQVGDAEPAAEVVDVELADPRRAQRRRAGRGRASAAASRCACAARRPSTRSARARAASGGMPNLEPAWPVRMCSCVSASTPGTTRMSRRGPPPSACSRSASCSLSITTVPTRASSASSQLGLRLRVAVQVQPLGREAGAQGEVQLAAGGDVAAEALLGEDTQHRRAREGLGGEDHLAGAVVHARQRLGEGAGAAPEIVLRDDVGGRAELARQLAGVAAADAEHAVRDGGVLGVHGRAGYLRARRGRAPRTPPGGSPARSTWRRRPSSRPTAPVVG